MKREIAVILVLAAALGAAPSLFAQANEADAQRLDTFAVLIATDANPQAAREFLRDKAFRAKALKMNAELAQKLVSYSEALGDLGKTLAVEISSANHNRINNELTARMDVNKPLCEIGVCPEPEKLLTWIGKYKNGFSAKKLEVIEKSIRKWEVVFGTTTNLKVVDWDQAKAVKAVTLQKADWEKLVLRERNAVIAKLAKNAAMGKDEPKFLQYSESTGRYLEERVTTVEAAKVLISSGNLTPDQLNSLAGKPFDQQIYLLGQYFDGGAATAHPELKAYIDRIQSQRTSNASTESLTHEQRAMLSSMLQTSLMNEVKGTRAGDRLAIFYRGGNPPVSVEYCNDCYSRYENGKIVIDAATIEQYMRVKGYKAEDLFKNKAAVDDITEFISPAFVRASANQMSDSYFGARGVYNPSVQERGVMASALEGLYTSEKLKTDAGFKANFEAMSPNSDYASKVMITRRELANGSSKRFSNRIAMLYYSDLPSAAAARSQVLSSISNELSRRTRLSEEKKKETEELAILSTEEVYQMSSEEFTGSVGEIKKELLLKVQTEMLSGSSSDRYYRTFLNGISRDYRDLNSPTTQNKVPLPGATL